MKVKTFISILDLLIKYVIEKLNEIKNRESFDPERESVEFDQYIDLLIAHEFFDEEIKEQIKKYLEESQEKPEE